MLFPLILLGGCKDRGLRAAASREPGGPVAVSETAPLASFARLLGVDAGELAGETPDPPSPAGDLAAEIAHFTTLDVCVGERAPVDPLLGDALEGIGYDTFLRDACRVLDAAKAGDPSRCDAIDASSLRTQCRTTVAETTAAPDGCPWASPSRPDRGRDARCVAIAARAPALCAAASTAADRATCEAVVRRDPALCRQLGVDAARCARDVTRWRSVLGPPASPERNSVTRAAPSGALHLEERGGRGALDVDLGPDLARGVTLVVSRAGARFALGPLTEGVDFVAPSPHVRASLALGLFLPNDGAPAIEHAELLVPGRAAIATPYAHSTLALTIDAPARGRGGSIEFTVEGEFGAGRARYRVHAEGRTFVRDVVRHDVHALPPDDPADSGADDAGVAVVGVGASGGAYGGPPAARVGLDGGPR